MMGGEYFLPAAAENVQKASQKGQDHFQRPQKSQESGRQPLEVEYGRNQQALNAHLRQASPPGSTQAMPLLRLGKDALNNWRASSVQLLKIFAVAVGSQTN